MSRYHVAVVAPPWYPVPPSGYGGIELVVHLLMGELRRRDIDVTLFAAEGSDHDAVELAPKAWSDDLGGMWHQHREVTYLGRVVQAIEELQPDLVHDHAGWASPLVFGQSRFPTLHTIHGPLYEVQRSLYQSLGDRAGLVAISQAQHDFAPELNWAGMVHNSVDVDALRVGSHEEKEDYLLCLARISPEKGQHVAIDVARAAGRRLVLAGKIGEQPGEQAYFDTQVKPHIDGDRVVYIDNVSGTQKADVLARAAALLAPLQWPEPFGLAMVEAMASGTPCIAISRGAAPELIEQGRTGLLCADAEAMVAAVEAAADIDPADCAARARARFSPSAMVDRYIEIYDTVLDHHPRLAVRSTTTTAATDADAVEQVPLSLSVS